ncbi:Hint domain-containing protein [Cysteiniphilum sp. 19S12-1]|uniref:Hint domain-containing protein n=1 Tax=Cysteiniphilum sp. 19S12-1 TaxID=3453130 RepID=UPI003F82B61C
MKYKSIISSVSLILSMGVGASSISYGGPQSYAACVLTCELACAGGLGITGGTALPAYLLCAETCPANCTWAAALCFSPDTQIIVLEDGQQINKHIDQVKVNDLVKTLHGGQTAWTRVTKNDRYDGTTELVEITLQDPKSDNQPHIKLKVTPLHGVVLMNDQIRTIDIAKNTVIGDKMECLDGKVLQVIGVDKSISNAEYTFETASGTVLASGVLVSTIYDASYSKGERLYHNTGLVGIRQ